MQLHSTFLACLSKYFLKLLQLCHKTGMLHLRPASPPEDFFLVAPTDPNTEDSGLSTYKKVWYFCKTCGVRCFIARGEFETVEVELPAERLQKLDVGGNVEAKSNADGLLVKKISAWKPVKDAWGEDSYLSVNMHTLDAEQEGLDLRTFTEQGWFGYYGKLKDLQGYRHAPLEGGTY